MLARGDTRRKPKLARRESSSTRSQTNAPRKTTHPRRRMGLPPPELRGVESIDDRRFTYLNCAQYGVRPEGAASLSWGF